MSARRVAKRRGCCLFFAVFFLIGSIFVASELGIFAQRGMLKKLDAQYVIVDLSKGDYVARPALAQNGRAESFRSIVGRLKPYAAICGTYYDPEYKPLGDILIDGKLVSRGCQRQGIGFTSKGKIKFVERVGQGKIDWQGCVSGIACGPRLVRNGIKDINVKRDGFRESAATLKARRCAVGATEDGKLILCAIPQEVTLSTMADAMLELGAVNAVNMDGGSMCTLYGPDGYQVEPFGYMSNILAVYKVEK